MKYLLFILLIVMFKYFFNREGLYLKTDLIVNDSRPNISNLVDKALPPNGFTKDTLEKNTNDVNPNIFNKQYSMININDIPLFYK